MDEIKISKLDDRSTEKGATYNFSFEKRLIKEIPVFYRKKGSILEGHFHKGTDSSNDPQIIVIVKGSLRFTCYNFQNEKKEYVVKMGEMISIPKLIFHEYEVLEDTIFFEPRLEKYDISNPDAHSIKEM